MKERKPFTIMKDRGSWSFTDEQIYKIRKCDPEAIRLFFTENYDIIVSMAKRYYWSIRWNKCFELNDLINQVYVDLPYYSYTSRTHLWQSIVYGSFAHVNTGGCMSRHWRDVLNASSVSLNATAFDEEEGKDFTDIFGYECDPLEELTKDEERDKKDEIIIDFLKKTVKDPIAFNAIYCKIFTDLAINQLTGGEYGLFKACENNPL